METGLTSGPVLSYGFFVTIPPDSMMEIVSCYILINGLRYSKDSSQMRYCIL